MADDTSLNGAPPPVTLDNQLRMLPEDPVPGDLLDRCLATTRRARSWTLASQMLRVAATLLLVVGLAIAATRMRPVDAADVLKSVKAAWIKVDASHQVTRMTSPEGPRTEEAWFVQGKGWRKEVRWGNVLVGVVVNNGRWEFRWHVPGKLVAAWSSDFTNLSRNKAQATGLVLDREGFVKWAESHRGEILIENDTLAGQPVRKVAVNWPAPEGGKPAAYTHMVWFDPTSLLPLRQRIGPADGDAVEITIDYPTPSAVKDDLFRFTMPRDVVLEINDPDLGRQVYSDGQPKGGD